VSRRRPIPPPACAEMRRAATEAPKRSLLRARAGTQWRTRRRRVASKEPTAAPSHIEAGDGRSGHVIRTRRRDRHDVEGRPGRRSELILLMSAGPTPDVARSMRPASGNCGATSDRARRGRRRRTDALETQGVDTLRAEVWTSQTLAPLAPCSSQSQSQGSKVESSMVPRAPR